MTELTEIEKFYCNDGYGGFKDGFTPDHYSSYVNFVKKFANGRVYEIGSGLGEAAYSLHLSNVEIIATDIFPDNAKGSFKKQGVEIPVEYLNTNKIDKSDNSVDNYSLYQVLEHIETPEKTIKEIHRTLKPGGRFIIVGPNLISPLSNMKAFIMGAIGKWPTPWLVRKDGFTYPFGNTVITIFFKLFHNFGRTLLRQFLPFMRKPIFRIPCLKKPAISDSDAVFLMNPYDVRALLEKNGFKIISYQEQRSVGSWAGSTWIVAEK